MNRTALTSAPKQIRNHLMLYVAGVSALALLVACQLIRIQIDWSAARGRLAQAAASKLVEYNSLNSATAPLRGMGQHNIETRQQIDAFYTQRIPASYSAIAEHIGEAGAQSGVQLLHSSYTQNARKENLTEISIDSEISGDYPQILRFVNGLERDSLFFVIRAMTLNGQQGGTVDMQLRYSAWLRPAQAAAAGAVSAPSGHSAAADRSGAKNK